MGYIKHVNDKGEEHMYWDGKLPAWEPCNAMGECLHRMEEEGKLIGIKYPLPKTDKHPVHFDNEPFGMWDELLKSYSDKSGIGIVANKSTTVLNSKELTWEETDRLTCWIAMWEQYTIDYCKTGTPIDLHPDVAKEINDAINPRKILKPSFMRLCKENEDEARRVDNNRCVREMTADGKDVGGRKIRTKADDDARYDTPNADRTMGKIELAVNSWIDEHIPDGLGNIYIEGYDALAAPRCCSDETRAKLFEVSKKANDRFIDWTDRINMNTATDQQNKRWEDPKFMARVHELYDEFTFEDLLDIALNEQKGSICFAVILLLHKDKFIEYCNSEDRVLMPGDYYTSKGHQKYSHKVNKKDAAKGTKNSVAASKEKLSKPVYCINENEEIVYYNKSQINAATELELKRPNLNKYMNDGLFHKVKSLNMKLMFIENLDEYIINDRLSKGYIVVVDEDGQVICAEEKNKDVAAELGIRPAAITKALKDNEYHKMGCYNKRIKFLKHNDEEN